MKNIYQSSIGKFNTKITSNYNIVLNFQILKKIKFKNENCLIVGVGDGELIKKIHKLFKQIVIIENDKNIFNNIKKKINYKKLIWINDDIINLNNYHYKFDLVLANHVLEHVTNPVNVLKKIRTSMKKDSIGILTVPNCNSFHRHIGIGLNIINTLKSFTNNDILMGHKRVYDLKLLENHIHKSKLKIIKKGYYNFKINSQKIMSKLSKKDLDELFNITFHLNDPFSSNIYATIKK